MDAVEQAIEDFQAGTITEADYYKIIDGEEGDTTTTPESAPGALAGASPDSKKTEPSEKTKEPVVDPVPKEPIIVAKDGIHTIPYSELADARAEATRAAEQIAVLQAKLAEKANIGAQMVAAQEDDAKTGTTGSTDELMADLALEFPEAAKMIMALKNQVAILVNKDQQASQAQLVATQEATARKEFDDAVAAIQPQYKTVEADQKFWDWFRAAPAYIQAAQNSDDPKVVAAVITTYLDSKKAPVGDTTKKPSPDMKKVAAAIAKAEAKPSVNSLGDIPGGSNPAHDELENLKSLNSFDLSQKMASMDPRAIETLLARML
jgi:hypothetical protein